MVETVWAEGGVTSGSWAACVALLSCLLLLCSSTTTSTNSADMIADCLTKPLASPAIRRFAGAMSGLRPIPRPPFGGPIGRIGHSLSINPRFNPHGYSLLSDL